MDKRLLLLSTTAVVIVVLLAGVFGTQTSLAQLGASGGTTVAVCDVVEVFNNYERASDLAAEFKIRRDKINEESEARRQAIEDKSQEMQHLLEGSPEYEKQLQEFQRMIINAEVWARTEEGLAQRDQLRLTTDMYEEILKMVKVIAEEQGYGLVLFREGRDTEADSMQEMLAQMQNRKILFSSDDIDITGRVLSRLNMAYSTGE